MTSWWLVVLCATLAGSAGSVVSPGATRHDGRFLRGGRQLLETTVGVKRGDARRPRRRLEEGGEEAEEVDGMEGLSAAEEWEQMAPGYWKKAKKEKKEEAAEEHEENNQDQAHRRRRSHSRITAHGREKTPLDVQEQQAIAVAKHAANERRRIKELALEMAKQQADKRIHEELVTEAAAKAEGQQANLKAVKVRVTQKHVPGVKATPKSTPEVDMEVALLHESRDASAEMLAKVDTKEYKVARKNAHVEKLLGVTNTETLGMKATQASAVTLANVISDARQALSKHHNLPQLTDQAVETLDSMLTGLTHHLSTLRRTDALVQNTQRKIRTVTALLHPGEEPWEGAVEFFAATWGSQLKKAAEAASVRLRKLTKKKEKLVSKLKLIHEKAERLAHSRVVLSGKVNADVAAEARVLDTSAKGKKPPLSTLEQEALDMAKHAVDERLHAQRQALVIATQDAAKRLHARVTKVAALKIAVAHHTANHTGENAMQKAATEKVCAIWRTSVWKPPPCAGMELETVAPAKITTPAPTKASADACAIWVRSVWKPKVCRGVAAAPAVPTFAVVVTESPTKIAQPASGDPCAIWVESVWKPPPCVANTTAAPTEAILSDSSGWVTSHPNRAAIAPVTATAAPAVATLTPITSSHRT